jgi:hypothetical protein
VIAFAERQVYTSKLTAWYFQPETFIAGTLLVSINPFRSKRTIEFKIPSELARAFSQLHVAWPEMS